MANIRIELDHTIKDGEILTFKAPCACSSITGINVYYPDENGVSASKALTFRDAHKNNLANIDNLFAEGAIVKVIVDAVGAYAYIQNADTNAYIESHFTNKNNPHGVTKSQVGLGNVDNTADSAKPVSTAQATAIADAKKAGTDAQSTISSHASNKNNPHGVTAIQVGADPTGTAASAVSSHNNSSTAHSDIRTAVSNAASVASAAQNTANGKASTITYTIAVSVSWSADSAGGYTRTISTAAQGILETDNPIADVVLGSDVDANAAYLEAWALVTRIETQNNKIILYANGDAPASAFTMQLKVVR